jgi:thiamine biosynthesis lipoprotein
MLWLSACGIGKSDDSEEYSCEVFAMDTYMSLKAYGNNAQQALEQAQQTLYNLDALWSVTEQDSEIYTVNSQKTAQVSQETLNVIEFACQMGKLTDGALDISIYPVMKAWGFTTGEYNVPEESTLEKLLKNVDYRRITCQDGTVSIEDGMQIDLGAVAKGWAGDELADIMRSSGVESAILSLGGNIQTVGSKPDGSDWNVAVQHPENDGYIGVVSVSDCAVVTSGGYERYFTDDDGNVYWHIIDPQTGYPANSGIISATIVGRKGKKCDALSTAVFIMGLEKASELWAESDDFEMILMLDDGSVYITQGLKDTFTPYGGIKYEVIYR